MLIELSFAHFLSAIVGGTLLQYAITIGLFTFALGLAAIVSHRKDFGSFIQLQFLILITGIIVSGIFLWALRFQQASSLGYWVYGFYLPVFLIGFLTGFEYPFLVRGRTEQETVQIFAVDYVGMFCATLVFPLYLLPQQGILFSIGLALSLNGVASILWWRGSRC
jgi:predicted membrane-bound spermidine synthase